MVKRATMESEGLRPPKLDAAEAKRLTAATVQENAEAVWREPLLDLLSKIRRVATDPEKPRYYCSMIWSSETPPAARKKIIGYLEDHGFLVEAPDGTTSTISWGTK